MRRYFFVLVVAIAVGLVSVACGTATTPVPTSTPTPNPTATPTPEATLPSPTEPPTSTPSPAPVTPTATSPAPTATPTPSATTEVPAPTAGATPAATPEPTSPPSPEMSTLEVRVTDDPAPEGVTKILVTVNNIEANLAAGEVSGGWITIIGETKTFDLMEIIGIEELLGTTELAPGQYNQIRLDVEQVIVTLEGEEIDARVPSGKLRVVGQIGAAAGETTVLTLDFDAGKSLVVTGQKERSGQASH